MMKKCSFVFGLIILCVSCAGYLQEEPKLDWTFSLEKPAATEALTYADDSVEIKFIITPKQIGFDIQNKTDSEIKIDWDEIFYRSPAGRSLRVIHRETQYADKDSLQVPTVIPPNEKISDFIIPSELIFHLTYGGWTTAPLFDFNTYYRDKTFGLYFPLVINGNKKEYSFEFKIGLSQIKPEKKKPPNIF